MCVVVTVEPQTKHPGIVVTVVGDAQTHADDHPCHGWAIQDVAYCHIANTHGMLVGDMLQDLEKL